MRLSEVVIPYSRDFPPGETAKGVSPDFPGGFRDKEHTELWDDLGHPARTKKRPKIFQKKNLTRLALFCIFLGLFY